MTAKLSVEFRRTTWSFRRISEAEAKAIKPLKVRVVTVKDGDTAHGLSARMPLGKFNRRWFETMNRNALGRGLAVGDAVKTVGNGGPVLGSGSQPRPGGYPAATSPVVKTPNPTVPSKIEERLSKLKELLEKGLITPDEAAKKRENILNSL